MEQETAKEFLKEFFNIITIGKKSSQSWVKMTNPS